MYFDSNGNFAISLKAAGFLAAGGTAGDH